MSIVKKHVDEYTDKSRIIKNGPFQGKYLVWECSLCGYKNHNSKKVQRHYNSLHLKKFIRRRNNGGDGGDGGEMVRQSVEEIIADVVGKKVRGYLVDKIMNIFATLRNRNSIANSMNLQEEDQRIFQRSLEANKNIITDNLTLRTIEHLAGLNYEDCFIFIKDDDESRDVDAKTGQQIVQYKQQKQQVTIASQNNEKKELKRQRNLKIKKEIKKEQFIELSDSEKLEKFQESE